MASADAARVVAGQHDPGRLDRDIRPRADRDAEVGLRQRRGVVHAVADHRHPGAALLQPGDDLRPCRPGSTSANTSSRPSCAGDPAADFVRVAGEHGHPDAAPLQLRDRLRRLRPDHIRQRDRVPSTRSPSSRNTVVLPSDASRRTACTSSTSSGQAALGDHALAGDRVGAAVHVRLDAAAGEGREAGRARHRDAARCRLRDDRLSQRMLGAGLHRRREREHLVAVHVLSAATTSETPRRPRVRVPVLSKSTTSTRRASSSARRLRISRPWRAPSAVEICATSGMARPRACGQAMMSTVTTRSSTKPGSSGCRSHQATSVSAAAPSAT